MKKLAYFSIALLLIVATVAVADDAKLLRYPAPSPDGQTIAFSYQGDIWTVGTAGGRAERLTIHEAYDYKPVWSPDGSKIAFTSARYGHKDVFVMDADGSGVTRLTFFSANDVAESWTADGSKIIFGSNRDYSISGASRVPYIFTISVSGGEPVKLSPESGNDAELSHDGTALAFVDHSASVRVGYRGASNNNIWVWHAADDSFVKVTSYEGVDNNPMWSTDDSAIYYLSEGKGFYNIWKHDIASDTKSQITEHDGHARYPSISYDGSLIAYELGLDLYALNTATGVTSKINVELPGDLKANQVVRKSISSGASEMAISPDEKEIAFVVAGEIYAMKEKGGTAHRLTNSSAREMDIAWNAEGTALFYSSDRDGDYDLYMLESDDPDTTSLAKALAYKETKLFDTTVRETGADLSPDGKELAYVVHDKNLFIYNLESKTSRPLLEGWNLGGFNWSPDSKWIAFQREDHEFNGEIWVIPSAGGKEINISKHPDNEFSPIWSKDGSKLAFISRRMGNNMDVWFVYLNKADDQRTKEDWEELAEAKKADKKDKKDDEEKPELKVTIDFDEINVRLRRVLSMAGRENSLAISPDGQNFVFSSNTSGKNDLYAVKWDGSELKKIVPAANAGRIVFSKDGKKIYFTSRGGIKSVPLKGGKLTSHAFNARTSTDRLALRMQKYEEAWRTLDRLFYDGKFHGVDWKAVRDEFRPYAAAAASEEDYTDIVNWMYGRLNGSHLGYRGGPASSDVREATATLGLIWDTSYAGPGLKVAEVFKGGPADREASKIKVGQYLMAINGTPVSLEQNISELLIDSAGKKVALLLADAPDAEATRMIIRPASTRLNGSLLYERFVKTAAEQTHKLSNDRIGYLHIKGMSNPSLERFEMELYSEANGKDAIVIDVRNNGGGSTTDMILAMLQVKEHAWTQARGSVTKGYPQDRRPLYAFPKPIIVLCNEYSYSNAEIFSWSIQTLGRGKVVGQETFGAVISTGGYGLIDGSYVRTPFRGWYVYGSDINMENNGCPPDVVVEYQPGDTDKGIDRQLEKAVELLLEDIK
jgi:tricorn protease